jgi:hypothetical protein
MSWAVYCDFRFWIRGGRCVRVGIVEIQNRQSKIQNLILGQLPVLDQTTGHGAGDFGAGFVDDARIVRVLPLDQFFDQIEQIRPLLGRQFLQAPVHRVVVGIVHQRRE